MLSHLFENTELFLQHYGVMAVPVVIFFEAFGAPVPAESLLVAASVMASKGELPINSLMLLTWVAATAGDNLGYVIGRFGGRKLVRRYGAKVFLTADRLDYVESFFFRYGGAVVLFARFVNVLRQLNGIVAGTMGMPWWRFFLFNATGAALWVGLWAGGVYWLGSNIHLLFDWHDRNETYLIATALLVISGAIYLGYRRWKKDAVGAG